MTHKRNPVRPHPGALMLAGFLVGSCNGEIYVRDGVTDGDTFYLAERALSDTDPVLQSWVSYSLTRSACQLQTGGDNPARANSFQCELQARRHLLEAWLEKRDHAAKTGGNGEEYLEELVSVQEAGYLPEYVATYFGQRHWQMPAELDRRAFRAWRRAHLAGHKPVTWLTGSWNYARKVGSARDRIIE